MKIKKSLSNGIAKQQHIAKLLENWIIRPRQRTNGRYDKVLVVSPSLIFLKIKTKK